MAQQPKQTRIDELATPENIRQPQTIQLLGVPPDLVGDIRDMLRKLPHVEVDYILKRLGQCQVLDVQVQNPPGA